MKVRWDMLSTAMLVTCALTTTGLVVHRELLQPATRSGAAVEEKEIFIDDWKSHLSTGVQVGPSNARVQLIEFVDFECPYCAQFHKTLQSVRDRYPTEVAMSYVHYPLPMHRFAEAAAKAAECAGEQGRFEAMSSHLFERQTAFGVTPWITFGTDAGMPDPAAFDSCIQRTQPFTRITAGRELGERLDIKGTPTLIINGWKLTQPPSEQELHKMVKAVLAGKNPVSSRR